MNKDMKSASNDVRTIEEFHDLLQDNCKLEVLLVKKSANKSVIQVNDNDPESARKWFAKTLLPRLGIDFEVPRFTKKTRYMILLHPNDEPQTSIPIVFKKGGDLRAGRKNETSLQQFVQNQIDENDGVAHMKFFDNYGKVVELDIVEVHDMAASKDKANRSDTTFVLSDGSRYGVSQKKTNATYACKCLKALKQILPEAERRIRTYIREGKTERNPGDYFTIRITNRNFIDMCWFGNDISRGAVFIGDLENMDSSEVQMERIIENGDRYVLDSFPLYACWKVLNKNLTLALAGITIKPMGKYDVVNDIEIPGFNAQMREGRRFVLSDEPKRRRHHRRRKTSRKIDEDDDQTQFNEDRRQDRMWDEIAWCAENSKMVWLKYETIDEGNIIHRRVAPYSYRTRTTSKGRNHYFYAEDFTPGQEHTIKSFRIDNCLDAKRSPTTYRPKWDVEIKQKIDDLAKKDQERDDSEKQELKNIEKPEKKELTPPRNKPMVKKDEVKPSEPDRKPTATPSPTKDTKQKPMKPVSKPPEPKPVKSVPRPQPTKDYPVVQKKDINSEPDQKKERTPSSIPPPDIGNDEQSKDNTVSPPSEDGEIQVTDKDGNPLN